MLKHIQYQKMGRARHGWLDSHFHFSFADYYNPKNIQFGVLRVINDDLIEPGTGFETHPHRDMEILSYVVSGSLTHADSMGHEHTITRGQVQYMSAGTGITHSEHNRGKDWLRMLQIWIFPDQKGYEPVYGSLETAFDDRIDRWMPIASGTHPAMADIPGGVSSSRDIIGFAPREEISPIQIRTDANLYALLLTQGREAVFPVAKDRQAYLVLIEGGATVGAMTLSAGDAVQAVSEDIRIHASEDAHMIVIEMAKA